MPDTTENYLTREELESALKTALNRLKNELETERLTRERECKHEKFESQLRRGNLWIGIMAGGFGGFTVAMILFSTFFHH